MTISNIPCQSGSFIFTGKDGIKPVILKWTCVPQPEQLEDQPTQLTVQINNVQDLLNGSQQAKDDIKQQIRNDPHLKGRSVGLAIVYGGATDGNNSDDRTQAENIATKIITILEEMTTNEKTFTPLDRALYYKPLVQLFQNEFAYARKK